MKKKNKKAKNMGMAANTTSWDWGHGPVAGKGGKTANFEIDEKDRREQTKSKADREKG